MRPSNGGKRDLGWSLLMNQRYHSMIITSHAHAFFSSQRRWPWMLGSTLWWWMKRWKRGWSGSRWRSNSEELKKKHVITWHFCLTFVIVQLLFDKFGKAIPKCIKQVQISELHSKGKMASALGNLMANYTDSEGEELAEGGSEGEGEGNPSLADRWNLFSYLFI